MGGAPEQSIDRPAWYPPGTDLHRIGQAARTILEGQGCVPKSFGKNYVENIVFTDADHTLMKTNTPVLLRNKETGEVVHHPKTGEVIKLDGKRYKELLAELKKEFPNEPWDQVEFDYSGMASARELKRQPGIGETLEMLREANAKRKGREFIITARSADNMPVAFDRYTATRGVELDGVFPVNGPQTLATLGIDPSLPTPHKKAIIMAALIDLYGPGAMKTVRFFEDGDANLIAAMELLPRLYPHIAFEFVDVVHDGQQHFSQHTAGTSPAGMSGVLNEQGQPMTDGELRNYHSDDVPLTE